MAALRACATVLAMIALAACERAIVEGRALNPQGEALPGVIVRLSDTGRQDLTEARGRYRLTADGSRSTVRLLLSKSGYAPTQLEVELRGRMLISAPDAVLWPLPLNPGVYTMDGRKYIPADWVLPRQYYLEDGSSAFGAELPETLRAHADGQALSIVCFRTPRYNARLSRLASANATIPGGGSEPIEVWVESGTVGAGLRPIDQPEAHLLSVMVDRALEPGIYAVHWGAMEGYTTLDNRVYVFEVVAPPEPTEETDPEQAPAEGETTAEEESEAPDGEEAESPPADETAPSLPDLIEPVEESPVEP